LANERNHYDFDCSEQDLAGGITEPTAQSGYEMSIIEVKWNPVLERAKQSVDEENVNGILS
jgi:hypothetical protein